MKPSTPRIGIKENLLAFTLLVVTNFFVGSMVGIEQTVLPLLGEEQFGLASTSATAGWLGDRFSGHPPIYGWCRFQLEIG